MSRIQANLLLTLVALIWGSAFVFQSQGMAHVGPMAFTGVRFLLGALVVVPLMVWEARQLRRSRKLPQRADVLQIVGLGTLLTLGAALQQMGIVGTSVTNAGFLTALYVPLVPLLGWLVLHHRAHWSAWPAAFACVVGAYLLSGAQSVAINRGDWLVIASTLPWAFHVLLIGRVADRLGAPFLVAGGQFAVCGVLALAWGLLLEPLDWASLQAAALPIAYTGVLSVGVAFTGQVVAQRYAHATDAAILLSSETVFAAAFGYALMGDRLNATGLVGCALIFVSMLGVQLLPLLHQRRAAADIRD